MCEKTHLGEFDCVEEKKINWSNIIEVWDPHKNFFKNIIELIINLGYSLVLIRDYMQTLTNSGKELWWKILKINDNNWLGPNLKQWMCWAENLFLRRKALSLYGNLDFLRPKIYVLIMLCRFGLFPSFLNSHHFTDNTNSPSLCFKLRLSFPFPCPNSCLLSSKCMPLH